MNFEKEKDCVYGIKDIRVVKDVCMDYFDEDIVLKNERDDTLQELLFVGVCRQIIPFVRIARVKVPAKLI